MHNILFQWANCEQSHSNMFKEIFLWQRLKTAKVLSLHGNEPLQTLFPYNIAQPLISKGNGMYTLLVYLAVTACQYNMGRGDIMFRTGTFVKDGVKIR